MKRTIFISLLLLGICLLISCDKEEEINQPPVIDIFEIEVTADGNTVYLIIDYDVSDPDGDNLDIVIKRNILEQTYFEKNMTSNRGSIKMDVSRNTPYRIQLIVTDDEGESVGQEYKVFIPLDYNS